MKPIIFSGVQPSGNLHIGNYLGAISQWVEMQNEYDCIFCVVDYHAITVKQNPEELKKRIIDIAKIYLALGIDPKKSIIFQQSHVRAHTELGWILNCTSTRISDLKKMTQFKDKAGIKFLIEKNIEHLKKKQEKNGNIVLQCKNDEDLEFWAKMFAGYLEDSYFENNISIGLFDYPVLMAADILLYNTDLVPVGEDQVQHVELCRDLAKRFNNNFGEVFKIPNYKIRKEGARIMGLDDPTKKMSKSASSPANFIALNDDIETAKKKIMRATTDSDGIIKFDKENKPGISNLLIIFSNLANISIKELKKNYQGKGYGDFKKDLAEVVALFLKDFQAKYNSITDAEVKKIMVAGADKIRPIAEETLRKVKEKIGVA